MNRFLALAFALALCLPLAAAAGSTEVLDGATSRILPHGNGSLTGPLRGIQLGWDGQSAAGAGPFDLTADHLAIETRVDSYEGYAIVVPEYRPSTETSEAGSAHVYGQEKRPNHRLSVYPSGAGLASVHTDFPGQSVAASDGKEVTAARNGDHGAPQNVSTTGSVQWAGQGDLVVSGDFVVVLWEWDAAVQAADGSSQTLSTGTHYEPLAAGLPPETEAAYRHGQDREAYLVVSHGTLRLPQSLGSQAARAYVDSGFLQVRGTLEMQDVVGGQLHKLGRPVAPTVTIGGDLQVRLESGKEGALPFHARSFGAASIESDGAVLTLKPSFWPAWASSWGLLAIPMVGLLGRWGQLRIQDRRLGRAEALLEMEHFGLAARSARRLSSSRRHHDEAGAIEVEALLRSGDWMAADARINDGAWSRGSEGLRLFLAARCLVLAGRRRDATAALRASLSANPDLRAEALNDPSLHAIMGTTASSEAYA